ncbi:MAG: arginine-tRNA-protein transferase [Blastocatellales bacterium]
MRFANQLQTPISMSQATLFINEYFLRHRAMPEQMDKLWATGWRHFGEYFYRYSIGYHDGEARVVIPLRIDLTTFSQSKSQKRAWTRNRDLKVVIRDAFIDEVKHQLFQRHKKRFRHSVPDTIYDFLSGSPADTPCPNNEIAVFDGDRLIGVSFLDLGQTSTSSVYAMFEPEESKRSLGIFMILQAIEYSRQRGCRYYYPGYAYRGPSFYDYKKNFYGLEAYDWQEGWKSYQPDEGASEE